jgi:hypothetical protein
MLHIEILKFVKITGPYLYGMEWRERGYGLGKRSTLCTVCNTVNTELRDRDYIPLLLEGKK